MSRMTIDDVRAFVVPIRLRQLARQEGYCEVAVDVRLLADMQSVVEAARTYVANQDGLEAAIQFRDWQAADLYEDDVATHWQRLRDALAALGQGAGKP